jgi:hypothetical protein
MRQSALYTPLLILGVAACESGGSLSPSLGRTSSNSSSGSGDFVQEVVVDSVHAPASAGAPVATTEGDDFRLERGGIQWFSGGQVEYTISGTDPLGGDGNTAILAAVATVDNDVHGITTRTFVNNNATTQTNPCTGSPNTVHWGVIDGAGGIVASTGVCFILQTKEIVGFETTIDEEEPWVIGSDATKLDVQNTVTHEFGHVAGLDHVRPPQDGCLTMFPYVALGEIQKRTLGLGDKLGMQDLYASTDVSAGTCGT